MLDKLRSAASEIVTILMSVLLAIIIWSIAVRADDPIITKGLQIPVTSAGLLPINGIPDIEEETVLITIEGPTTVINNLTASDFQAVVDLSQASVGQSELDIVVEHESSATVAFQDPPTTQVIVEEIVDREIPVFVNVRGNAARGYETETPLINPQTIIVTGPATRVNQLDSVQLSLFLDDAREDVERVRRPVFVDRAGNTVSPTGLQLSAEEINVTVPINQLAGVAEKSILVTWTGEPAFGYRLLNIDVEPASLLVTGPAAVLDEVRSVRTEEVDLTGLTDSLTQQVAIELPDLVELDEVQPVIVSFEIQPILSTSIVRVAPEIRALEEGLVATLEPDDELTIVLSGPLPVLDTISSEDVSVSLDLRGLLSGTYSVAPIVTPLLNDIEVRSFQPSELTVIITDTTGVQAGSGVVMGSGGPPAAEQERPLTTRSSLPPLALRPMYLLPRPIWGESIT